MGARPKRLISHTSNIQIPGALPQKNAEKGKKEKRKEEWEVGKKGGMEENRPAKTA